jgi:hypothetical protein
MVFQDASQTNHKEIMPENGIRINTKANRTKRLSYGLPYLQVQSDWDARRIYTYVIPSTKPEYGVNGSKKEGLEISADAKSKEKTVAKAFERSHQKNI